MPKAKHPRADRIHNLLLHLQATLTGGPAPQTAALDRARQGADSPRARPFIIGVAGGTASGKTSVCRSIIDKLVAAGVCRSFRSIYAP